MTRDELERQVRRREEILEGVRRVLIENLSVRREPDEIDPDTPLFGTGLSLDSVDAVELMVGVENAFGLRFAEGTMDRRTMRTVGTLVDAVLAYEVGDG